MSNGAKRSFADLDQDDASALQGGGGPPSEMKRRKYSSTRHGIGKRKAKEGSTEWAKKRVRTIERMMRHTGDELATDARNELERELAAHKENIAQKSFQKTRSAMISKYHMVRFFERKKAARLAKQLQKKIDESSDPKDIEQLQHQLHVAEVDEAYTRHYPHVEPYISLYGGSKSQDDDTDDTKKTPIAKAAIKDERPPIWSEIEAALERGPAALAGIRERRPSEKNAGTAEQRASSQDKPATSRLKAQPKSLLDQRDKKAAVQSSQPKSAVGSQSKASGGQMPANRRERRALMRKKGLISHNTSAGGGDDDDDDDDEGGFFE